MLTNVLFLSLFTIGVLVGGFIAIHCLKKLSADSSWFATGNGVDEKRFLNIGPVAHYLRIKGRDRANPVLLFLHGGPGLSQIPYSHRTLRPLAEYFTLVEWDQAGAGRTKCSGAEAKKITYERMVEDAVAVIQHLCDDLNVDKVVLVGHSWGSMLGLGLAKARPDLIHAYVGVGQALNWPDLFEETRRLLLSAAADANDEDTFRKLSKMEGSYPAREDVDGLIARIRKIQSFLPGYGKSLHASRSNSIFKSELLFDLVCSPEAGLIESLGMLLKFSTASKFLMIDLYERDLREVPGTIFDVPMFIFQGEHDWQTPTTLVKPWFESIESPQKKYIKFHHAAHMVFNEEPGKFCYELIANVRPLAIDKQGDRCGV